MVTVIHEDLHPGYNHHSYWIRYGINEAAIVICADKWIKPNRSFDTDQIRNERYFIKSNKLKKW